MTVLLAGDIGGTKTILRLVESQGEADQATLHQAQYPSRNFSGLVPIVETFLAEANQKLGRSAPPEKACFGIAGPVVDGSSRLTNLAWSTLDQNFLSHELTIPKVVLINDFAAVGYGVLGLADSDLKTVQAGQPKPGTPIAVIGAGTGLGQGFLINDNGVYRVYGTEGGHADYAPRTELEFELSRYLLEKYQSDRISVERVVSGQGIVAIYQFLRDHQSSHESPEVAQAVRAAEQELGEHTKSVDPAAAISQAAIEQRDVLSEQTMKIFVEAYGAEAGNLALKLLPTGGLYVAGGVAAKNLPLLERYGFVGALLSKGRMRSLLEKIPVHIVLNPEVGLMGSAICAARL